MKQIPQNYFYLIEQFAITDFKMRFSKSVLGYLWSLIHPLFFFAAYYFVFSVVLKFDSGKTYAIHLLTGIIIWNFFCETTQNGMRSLSYKSSLLTKIKFPRIIIPLSSLVANILIFLINFFVFVIFLAITGYSVKGPAINLLFFFVCLTFFAFGISLILSSFYLKYRDIQHIWSILLQLGFWFVPIVYTLERVPAQYLNYFNLNPVSAVISGFQDVVIYHRHPQLYVLLSCMFISAMVLWIGLFIFQKKQSKFSEWV